MNMSNLGLPQVYRERECSFRIYYNEGNEPPHIHVVRGTNRSSYRAKFWLTPISLCENVGFNPNELRWMQRTIEAQHAYFLKEWYETQGRKR